MSKYVAHEPCGFVSDVDSEHLFAFQRATVRWALRRGRAAVFADTGLGKTRMELFWAREVHRHAGGNVLILAPLAVAKQTVAEGVNVGIDVRYVRSDSEVTGEGIWICNYEMLHALDASRFNGVVLDESSILKAFDGKTRNDLIKQFQDTPYRLACTATPAPNDHVELGNHSEFLGVMPRIEMLSMFFCHDGGDTQTWRLKGHARGDFWRWVCSWAVALKRPSDIGEAFSVEDERYVLPDLVMREHVIRGTFEQAQRAGQLFVAEATNLSSQRDARRASMPERVALASDLVNGDEQPWLVWCDLNAEGDALEKAIPGSVQIKGSDTIAHKESALMRFVAGEIRVLVTKPSIAGFGLNFQHCAREVFVGVSHSFEDFYQCVRRCWRFGQDRQVEAHVVISEAEGAVLANLKRKEREAMAMSSEMVAAMRDIERQQVASATREIVGYEPRVEMVIPAWLSEEV